MATTTNLGIPLVDQSQAQKEVTINQAFTCLDAMIGSSVADKDLATPPASPVTGVVYIVAASPTGAWAGKAGNLSYFDQVWRFIAPAVGMRVWVRDEGLYYQYNGTVWQVPPMFSGPGSTTPNAVAKWNATDGMLLANSGVLIDASNNISGAGTVASGAHTITANISGALAVGANGATNPALLVDASTASSATGLSIKSAAAAGGVVLQTLSTGTNEPLSLLAKGTGNITIGASTTTLIQIGRSTISPSAAIFNNVSVSNTAAAIRFGVTNSADSALSAGTEATHTFFNLAASTRTHATGAIALQRDFRIAGTTHAAAAASTFTDVAAFSVDGPGNAGANVTITNGHGIYVPGTTLTGTVTNAYGLTVNAPSGATNNYAAYFNGTVGIGTSAPSATALLDISSTTKGFLPPRMTTTQKNAISSPAAGMMVYDSTLAKLAIYNGSSWDPASGATAVCEGRLTLTSGTAVTTSDVTAASTIYFTPFRGNHIALYDGIGSWAVLGFTEISLAVPATSNTNYDIWVYNNSGTPTLEATAWTSDTVRATALAKQDGVYVKSGATTRRYLGTFRTTATSGQTEDSQAKRYVWNYASRVSRAMHVSETVASWTYSTNAPQYANANSANRLQFVLGVSEDPVEAGAMALVSNSTSTMRIVNIYMGLDSSTGGLWGKTNVSQVATAGINQYTHNSDYVSAGYHYLAWIQTGAGADTQTWYGTDYSGIYGTIIG